MSLGIKLPPGQYRFTTTNPPTTVVYTVDDEGMLTTFGKLLWTESPPDGGAYLLAAVGVSVYADGTFVAMNGSQAFSGTWHRVS